MTDKAYIVTNEEQVVELYNTATDKVDFDTQTDCYTFPYVMVDTVAGGWISYSSIDDIDYDIEIVYDGRKESKMKINKEIYDALVEWKLDQGLNKYPIHANDLIPAPDNVRYWWKDNSITYIEQNNRLIAIIRWVNGEDVFEVEKSKKWVVRSKKVDGVNARYYIVASHDMTWFSTTVAKEVATVFDTEEEAKRYANDLMEVVETNE